MKKIVLGLGALVFGIAAVSGGGSGEADTRTHAEKTVSRLAADEGAQEVSAPAPKAEAAEQASEPELSIGQENALTSASEYLDYSAFSKSGLVEQLKFEGYSMKDAKFAANHVGADWNEQAAKSAEEYVSMSAFSREGLIEQLEFEGYSPQQAAHGAGKVGF